MEFKDKIKNIDPYRPHKTMFLTASEQAQLKNYFKELVSFKGGYDFPERVRAYFNIDVDDIVCFKIIYNKSYLTLTHQNILGSLLSLNVKREVIGDILAEHDAFFIIKEQAPFVIQEFTKIGSHSITLNEIDGSNLSRTIQLDENIAYIDSLRLDLVVSRLTKKSRNEANLMIENDLVSVNHLVVNKSTKTCVEKDIISIRKYGRFVLLNTQNQSKKGKIVLKYGKYI